MASPDPKLATATSYLILHHPFLAVPLLRLRLAPDPSCETAFTDGRGIYYNPTFIDSLTLNECIFLLAHEVLHVALAHHLRRGQRNLKAWNAATDYAINLLLEAAGFALIPGLLLDPVFKGFSAEQIYHYLFRKAQDELRLASSSSDPGSPQGTLEDHLPQGTGGQVTDLKAEDGQELSDSERTIEEGKLEVALQHARHFQAMGSSNQSLATAVSRAVAAPRSPSFQARQHLSIFMSQALGREDYSWTRPNRRFLPAGLYLPSLSRSDTLLDPIVAIDTSCSITPEHLAFLAGVCDDILEAFPLTELRLLYCDTEVRASESVTLLDRPIRLEKAEGGGGTRFAPVFEWVAQHGLQPNFLIYMTDLAGPMPDDPGYPVVWLVIDSNIPAPFGTRISLPWMDA